MDAARQINIHLPYKYIRLWLSYRTSYLPTFHFISWRVRKEAIDSHSYQFILNVFSGYFYLSLTPCKAYIIYTSFACLCVLTQTLSSSQCNNRNSDFMFWIHTNKFNAPISLDFRKKEKNKSKWNRSCDKYAISCSLQQLIKKRFYTLRTHIAQHSLCGAWNGFFNDFANFILLCHLIYNINVVVVPFS